MSKLLWFFAVLIILIIVGGTGGYVYVEAGKPKVISTESQPAFGCIDPDGNNIYQKSTVSYGDDKTDPKGTVVDFCDYYHEKTTKDVGLVREGVCEDGSLKLELSRCGRGFVCRDGACVEGSGNLPVCIDSDGGKDPSEKGNIVGYGGTGEDSCFFSSSIPNSEGSHGPDCSGEDCYVSEYFCDGDIKTNEIIPCPNGCFDGACL